MEKPFHLTKLWHHGNDSSVIQSGICVRIATLLRDTKSLSEPTLSSFQWYYQIHVPTKSQYIHIPSWNSTEKCVSELANFAQAANVLMSARADDSSHHAPLSRKPTAFCNPILSAAMQAQSFGDTQGQSNISHFGNYWLITNIIGSNIHIWKPIAHTNFIGHYSGTIQSFDTKFWFDLFCFIV